MDTRTALRCGMSIRVYKLYVLDLPANVTKSTGRYRRRMLVIVPLMFCLMMNRRSRKGKGNKQDKAEKDQIPQEQTHTGNKSDSASSC